MNNPAFQTVCSISIAVSAFGFLPNDKGSIPLWSAKNVNFSQMNYNKNGFVAQWVRVSVSYAEG